MNGQAAARIGDEIAHGLGLLAIVAGAVVGAVVGAAVIGAVAVTGGAAVAIMAGSIAAGGLSMGLLVKGLCNLFNLPEPTSGVLARGSPDVYINGLPAIRAGLDMAATCSGFLFNHFPMPMPLVAEGSETVFINGMPAGRLKDKLVCGAHIKSGSPNVIIGGEAMQVVPMSSFSERFDFLRLGEQVAGGVYAAITGALMIGQNALEKYERTTENFVYQIIVANGISIYGSIQSPENVKVTFSDENFSKWTGGLSVKDAQDAYKKRTGKTISREDMQTLFTDPKKAKAILMEDKEIHTVFRDMLNNNLPNSPKEALESGQWKELRKFDSTLHSSFIRGNRKFITKDGYREAVFAPDGTFDRSDEFKGTFNFFDPTEYPVSHIMADVDPYAEFGN